MKKLTQNQIQLILLLLMVIIVVAAYRFGFGTFDSMAQKVMKDNQLLTAKVSELEQKNAKKEIYEKGITDSKDELEALYSRYGTGITPEKSILMINNMEQQAQMTISNVAFAPENGIYFSTRLKADGTSAVSLNTSQLSLTFSTSYQGLKDCMNFINNYKERMNVESFNVVYNQETGQLDGAMIINLYSLLREGSEYTEPDIGGIDIGTDNIFGAHKLPADSGQ